MGEIRFYCGILPVTILEKRGHKVLVLDLETGKTFETVYALLWRKEREK